MAKVLEQLQRFRKVDEAVAQKDEPAPAFLLDEIAEMAKMSFEASQAIADQLAKRLTHKSPIVKQKALRLIKHLCVKGAANFQRSMHRHSQSVRDLLAFKGEPDPFKGDALNQRVRDSAKETLELLGGAVAASSPAQLAQGRIQGFGSAVQADPRAAASSTASAISSASNAAGRMIGFGSGTRPEQTSVSSAANTAAGVVNNLYKGATSMAQTAWGATAQQMERLHQNSNSNSNTSTSSFTPPPNQDMRHHDMQSSWHGGSLDHSALTARVMGSEESLVDEITASGGLRVLPDPEDLRRFVGSVSSMDGLRIGELLREKMESTSWQVCLKSMCALEAIIMQGSSAACGEAAIMFQSDTSPLHRGLGSPQATVREKAAALLELLTGEKVAAPPAAAKKVVPKSYLTGTTASAPAGQSQPAGGMQYSNGGGQVDLLFGGEATTASSGLDLLGDAPSPASQQHHAAPAPAYQAPVDALFSGLDMPAAAAAPSHHPAPAAAAAAPPAAAGRSALPEDIFGGLGTDAPAPTPSTSAYGYQPQAQPAVAAAPVASHMPQVAHAPSSDLSDMFAGLSTSTSGPAPGLHQQQQQQAQAGLWTSQPAPAPAPQHQQQVADLLGGMDESAGPGPSPQPGGAGMGAPLGGMMPMAGGVQMMGGMQMMPYMMPNGQVAYMPVMAPGMMGGMMPGMMPGYGGMMPAAGGMQQGMAPQQAGGMQQGMAPQAGMMQQQQQHMMAQGMMPQQAMPGMMHPGMQQPGMGGAPGKPGTWQGKDDLSALMRNVGSGGKHDPAFDFISNELKPNK